MPEENQVKLARKMIDAGADAVIGAHPHIPQTVDWYRGKPIVYSLGNFVFNYYPHDPPAYFGWIVRLTIGKDGRVEMKTKAVKIEPTGLPRFVTQDDKINDEEEYWWDPLRSAHPACSLVVGPYFSSITTRKPRLKYRLCGVL